MTDASATATGRATAKQWRTLAGLSKSLGYTSASALVAGVLERPLADVRRELPVRDAQRAIALAIQLQKGQHP